VAVPDTWQAPLESFNLNVNVAYNIMTKCSYATGRSYCLSFVHMHFAEHTCCHLFARVERNENKNNKNFLLLLRAASGDGTTCRHRLTEFKRTRYVCTICTVQIEMDS
jgi:hypothetical protein